MSRNSYFYSELLPSWGNKRCPEIFEQSFLYSFTEVDGQFEKDVPFYPFTDGTYVYATNGDVCLRLKKDLCVSHYANLEGHDFLTKNLQRTKNLNWIPLSKEALIKGLQEWDLADEYGDITENHDCPECDGDGFVEEVPIHAEYDDFDYEVPVECPICNGKGFILYDMNFRYVQVGEYLFPLLDILKLYHLLQKYKCDEVTYSAYNDDFVVFHLNGNVDLFNRMCKNIDTRPVFVL